MMEKAATSAAHCLGAKKYFKGPVDVNKCVCVYVSYPTDGSWKLGHGFVKWNIFEDLAPPNKNGDGSGILGKERRKFINHENELIF